ncbi:MAG: rhodanese-like domain-containing protein [Bryobacteraceae bacterium]
MKHSDGFLAIVQDAKTRVHCIDVVEYAALRDDEVEHVLIDVREESEWKAGHAAGAVHLGKGIIERDIEVRVPNKAARVVLYCGGGYRSALAADALGRMGYVAVSSLEGGWRAWLEAGMAVEE